MQLKAIHHDTAGADGRALMIAHGLYGSARNWGVIAKRLSDSRPVVAVDMRNHGDSPWDAAHGYADLGADLAETIAALGAPMDLLGHSMGGKAAMACALMQPDRVARLIVADIAPVAYGHSQLQYIRAMQAVDLTRVTRRSDAESQLAPLVDDPALSVFFTQSLDLAGKRWKLNLDALADQMPQILSFPDFGAARFEGPVLFLSGARSQYVRPEHRETIRRLFPRAQFAKIPEAGHWLHAEKPREFEAAVRHWLDSSDR